MVDGTEEEHEEFSGEDFTERERRLLRRLMQLWERMIWLLKLARLFAWYASAGIVGAYAMFDTIAKFLGKKVML